jgi:DNA repair exonuclease SbcCD ATPase subunit
MGRFKRSLLGYRARDVDQALDSQRAALQATGAKLTDAERRMVGRERELEERGTELARSERRVDELEQVAERLAERVVDRERALREIRAELERERERSDGTARTLAALAEDLAELRRQARGQATRMRLRALGEVAELMDRIGALGNAENGDRERLILALEQAVARIGAAHTDDEEQAVPAARSNGQGARDVFEGLVEVEVGPISDFSQLVGFEDAAAGIGATSEVSVRRFTQGRATLAMRFKHPVELLRELEERAPFEFRVRDTRSDRIVLDVDE